MDIKSVTQLTRRICVLALTSCWTLSLFDPATSYAQPVSIAEQGYWANPSGVSPNLFGMKIYADDPLRLDFLLEEGAGADSPAKLEDVQLMAKNFLTVLAIPEDQIWVNLSPTEPDRMIPDALRRTEMGRILLQQDEALKELTAEVLSPEHDAGKEFWQKLSDIKSSSSESFAALMHKVWIVPDYASVAVKDDQVFITDCRLKILNEDESGDQNVKELIQKIIVPALEDQVNHSEAFEPLRQIYRAMILAVWYKQNFKNGFLNAVYKDRMKLDGIDGADQTNIARVYDQYLQNFKSGAYNVIQEDYDPSLSRMVVKNYVSGGIDAASLMQAVHQKDDASLDDLLSRLRAPAAYPVRLEVLKTVKSLDKAMLIKPEQNLMVSMSLMDIAAYLRPDGALDYAEGFAKAQTLIKQLADSGVGNIYLYGGLYEMSESSVQTHQVEPGEQLVVSDNGKCFVLIPNYITKRQPRSSDDPTELRDHFGNNFSIYDLQRLNPKMVSAGKNPREEFQKLVAYAKSLGVDITVDLIPWLAPDAINETNLHWTKHRALTSLETAQVKKEDKEVRKFLSANGGSFLREINGTYYLIQHLDGGFGPNLDQVYPNAFLPEVQEYYINAVKNMLDLGVTSVRVDLAHKLLGSKLRDVFEQPDGIVRDSVHHEPLYKIMNQVQQYARDKNINFTWIMETYDDGDKVWMNIIAQEAQASARFYHKKIVDTYHALKAEGTAWGVAYELNWAIKAALNGDPEAFSRIAFLANFDEQSLINSGGSVESMVKLLILLSHLGVPVMIDLREWMLHSGQIIPTVGGGFDEFTQGSTHPFVNESEWKARMAEGGIERIVESMPWKGFVEQVQAFRKESQVVAQEHSDGYPEFFLDYADQSLRNDFLTVGWTTGQDLNVFVVNVGKNPEITSIDIAIPPDLQERYGGSFVNVRIFPGRNDQWVTVRPGGEIVFHNAAMMNESLVQKPGGIRLDARDLDIRQKGSWEGEWNLPQSLEQMNPDDVQGLVPSLMEPSVWHRPQLTQ